MIKERQQDKSTLAIGDGANDVSMITAAHIGVGIAGLEGAQASRAADYSFGQFKMLKNLMFCHGREAYRRNSYLVCYMFYKNVLYVTPIVAYGFISKFSGTVMYNLMLYNLYNITFTSLPVMWFAIFDQEYEKERLLADPKLYRIGIDDVFFNRTTFWRWFFYAVWQGALMLAITFITLDTACEQFGQIGGLTVDGNVMFGCLVWIANMKILGNNYQYTYWSVTLNLVSVLLYYVVLEAFSILELM